MRYNRKSIGAVSGWLAENRAGCHNEQCLRYKVLRHITQAKWPLASSLYGFKLKGDFSKPQFSKCRPYHLYATLLYLQKIIPYSVHFEIEWLYDRSVVAWLPKEKLWVLFDIKKPLDYWCETSNNRAVKKHMLALAHNTLKSVAIVFVHTIKSHHMQVNSLRNRMKDRFCTILWKQTRKIIGLCDIRLNIYIFLMNQLIRQFYSLIYIFLHVFIYFLNKGTIISTKGPLLSVKFKIYELKQIHK